jgi:hypothetical protein
MFAIDFSVPLCLCGEKGFSSVGAPGSRPFLDANLGILTLASALRRFFALAFFILDREPIL